jgi:hypothetical protein
MERLICAARKQILTTKQMGLIALQEQWRKREQAEPEVPNDHAKLEQLLIPDYINQFMRLK